MKVAFLITVYKNDKLQFFKQAIESIVNQTYGFDKINIYLGIDGEISKDIEEYINENKEVFFKIKKNNHNKGLAVILNNLIDELGEEQYIFRMDSDDICKEDRVEITIKHFKQYQNLKLIGSDLLEIDENGEIIGYKKMPSKKEDIINYAIIRNPFNHPTVAVTKDFFKIVGKYNEKYIKSQDYELWARALMKNIDCMNINLPLVYFRIGKDYLNKRTSLKNALNEFKVSLKLMKFYRKYEKFPIILLKLMIRIMPKSFNNFIYKKTRNKA